MIWGRLKKSTHEQEEDFKERMSDVPLKDRAIMTITAYAVLVIPSLLVIVGLSLFTMWIFGLL